MPITPRVLVALADPETKTAFSRALPSSGLDPVYTSSVKEARGILARESISMVFCEDRLADGNFRDMLRVMEAKQVPVVVTSRTDDPKEYLEAMKLGAFDFIAAPYRRAEVEWILEHALHGAPSLSR